MNVMMMGYQSKIHCSSMANTPVTSNEIIRLRTVAIGMSWYGTSAMIVRQVSTLNAKYPYDEIPL